MNNTTNQPNNNNKKQVSKGEKKRRAAQSRKDKANATGRAQPTQPMVGLVPGILKHEADLDSSVFHDLQTICNPVRGAHRPYNSGYDETALVSWESTFTVSGFNQVNNKLSLGFIPSFPAATNQFSWLIGPVLSNPFTTTDPGVVNIPGPFSSTNPSKVARTIAFEVILTPIGSRQQMSGSGCAALFQKGIVAQQWSQQGEFERQAYKLPFSGSDKIACHWIPSSDDRFMWARVTAKMAVMDVIASGIGIYFVAPNSTSVDDAWRVDVRQVIEYVPTSSYYPYVATATSSALPTTDHYVAQSLRNQSNPVVFGLYEKWFDTVNSWVHHGGHATHHVHHALPYEEEGEASADITAEESKTEEPFQVRLPRDQNDRRRVDDRDVEEEEQRFSELDLGHVAETGIRLAGGVAQLAAGNPIPLVRQGLGFLQGGQESVRKGQESYENVGDY